MHSTRFSRLAGPLLAALVLAVPAGSALASVGRQEALPWIADDWTRAVALAQQRQVPIFVENWAPW